MYKAVESHFAQTPSVDMSRSIFSRPSTHTTTFNVGELIPIYVDEILPGDSVRLDLSTVVRLQTLLTPVMDNAYIDIHAWYVPMRLTWQHWQEFCGENKSGAWAPTVSYTIPKIKTPAGGFDSGTLADYFGLPVKTHLPDTRAEDIAQLPSQLPFRAYGLICNEWYRDQNLTDPINVPLGDATVTGSNGSNYIEDIPKGGKPFIVSKYHDYFTSCLPSTQKGSPVSLPIATFSGLAPVVTGANHYTGSHSPAHIAAADGSSGSAYGVVKQILSTGHIIATNPSSTSDNPIYFTNLYANIPELPANAISVNDLRLAFQLQKYLERNALGGSRYVEFLLSHFGVTSPDARLQRPEYLGGKRIPLAIHQVTNTAQSAQDFLGDLGAMSVTSDSDSYFEHSFTEHGYLIITACARYDHTYSQGYERFWSRNTIYDFYDPLFANIGEQPVYTHELYCGNDASGVAVPLDKAFGFQEAWADYRYKPDRVSGEMRPGISNTLASWHFADFYTSEPFLSDAWIREDKTNVDRTLAVTSQVSNQILADFYFDATYTRVMPTYSVPGLIDHH